MPKLCRRKHQIEPRPISPVQQIVNWIVLIVLPKGSVKNETTFFTMLAILSILVVIAMVLRRRRRSEE